MVDVVPMTLHEFIRTQKGNNIALAARELEMPHETVRRYARGLRKPRQDRMQKIELWSDGEVTANDFYRSEATT